MSGVTLKLTSLVIRTLSKPIANQIKLQAAQHAKFRKLCITFAQGLHQMDMRLRLGLLRDTAAIEKQAAREAAEAQAKKHKHSESQTARPEKTEKLEDGTKKAEEKFKPVKPKIRPLSETKAIDRGATFISEAFLFMVAGGLVIFESIRSRRKESTRREDVSDRLIELEENERNSRHALLALEHELIRLRATPGTRILPKEVWVQERKPEEEILSGWRIPWFGTTAKQMPELQQNDIQQPEKKVQKAQEIKKQAEPVIVKA